MRSRKHNPLGKAKQAGASQYRQRLAEHGNKNTSLQTYGKTAFSRRKGLKYLPVPQDTVWAAFPVVRKVKDLNRSSRGAVVSPTLPLVKGSRFINIWHVFHTAAFD